MVSVAINSLLISVAFSYEQVQQAPSSLQV